MSLEYLENAARECGNCSKSDSSETSDDRTLAGQNALTWIGKAIAEREINYEKGKALLDRCSECDYKGRHIEKFYLEKKEAA